MRRWQALLDRYVEERYVAAGRAEVTIEGVRRELDRFGNWLRNRRPRPKLEDVDSDLVQRYVRGRSAFHGKSTLSGVMSKLRCWGEFLTQEGIWSQNPLRWMQGPRMDLRTRLPRRVGRDTLSELWRAAATSRTDYHRWVWVTLLSLFYGTGARRGEIVRLDVADWNRDDGLLLIDGRKTGWERRVPVPDLVWRCLEGYLPQRTNLLASVGRHEEPALFVNRRGERMTGTGITVGIRRLARQCGAERVTLHMFRHTCASDLLEEGAHMIDVQRLLGHQAIESTLRYLHITDPQLHAGVARHPINEFLAPKGADHE